MNAAVEDLVVHWGYLGVSIGTFIEGEAVLIAAGALARRGILSPVMVAACALAGSMAWSQLWFRIGRRAGSPALRVRPRWTARVQRCERGLQRNASLFVIGCRFIAGMSSVSPAVLGASGYPLRRFMPLDTAGAALWVCVFGGAGWGLGTMLRGLLGWS